MPRNDVLAIDSLDPLETEKSKKVTPPYYDPFLRLDIPDYSTKFNLNKLHQTTLDKAPQQITQKYFSNSPNLPELNQTKQTTALGFEISKAIQRNEKILQGIVGILINNINLHSEKIITLSEADEKQLKDLLDQLSRKENTNTVSNILNIISSASAITIGALLLAPETIAALTATAASATLYSSISSIWSYLLIATGISNIVTNQILPQIGGYEKLASFFTSCEKDKKNLAENIQITTSLTNTIMGVVSSIATSPLIGAFLKWSHGLKFLNTSLGLSSGAVNFFKDSNESSFKMLESNQTQIDGKLKMEQINLDRNFNQLQTAEDIEKNFNQISFKIFETLRKIQENNTK